MAQWVRELTVGWSEGSEGSEVEGTGVDFQHSHGPSQPPVSRRNLSLRSAWAAYPTSQITAYPTPGDR